MSLDEDPRSDEGCKHAVHFYEAGDVELKVGRVLFRVHRDRLCERSEVFSDMFELSQGGASGKDDVDSVSLHDDPDDFAILLDFIYELSVEYADAKECLQVALLGHKYEVALVTSSCVGYLRSFLPTGLTSRDFSIAQQYYDDPLMIPMVIRASRLFDIPEVIPWALYALAVHFGPNSGPEWVLERDEDRACVDSLTETLKDVSDIGQTYVAMWNRNIKWFLCRDCSTEWWVEEDECWRRSELSDLENSGFLLYKGTADPLYDMHEAADFCSDGLCPLCMMGFDRLSKQLMLMLLGEIGETDW